MHLLLLSSPTRAGQGLHPSPSWLRGLACRRPPSAVPATADVHASAPFAPILFRSRERHARTLQLVTVVPAAAIGSAAITRPRSSARVSTPLFIYVFSGYESYGKEESGMRKWWWFRFSVNEDCRDWIERGTMSVFY